MLRKKVQVIVIVLVIIMLGQVAQASGVHVVKAGETLWLISRQYNTTVDALVKGNSISNADSITVGQRLMIPGSGSVAHTVRAGETLWLISLKYGVTAAEIANANGITNVNNLLIGTRLVIPVSGGAATEPWVAPEAAPVVARSGNRSFSATEIDLFARLVHAEAAGEPYTGQVAVAATVLNRIDSPRYPNTLTAVIYQISNGYYQYSPVLDGRINLPANDSARRAVLEAINGRDPSLGATGFFNPRKTSNVWVRQQPVTTVIGNHVFFR